MRTQIITLVLAVTIAATVPLHAGKQPGSKTPIVVTFRDCQSAFASAAYLAILAGSGCSAPDDRFRSDWQQSYIDGEHGVEAFLGSQANSGNLLLNVKRSVRAIVLDFADCAATGSCTPPPSQEYSLSSIRVDATAVRKDGVLGMAINETMSAPMRVQYQFSPDQDPGFIDFNPNLTGKNVCKGASDYVSVTRTGERTWEVFADESRIGCVTLPGTGGSGWAGNYRFPFRFHVRVK